MSKNENAKRLHLRQKLISAAAMLLVASVLLVSTSYAWFVMSTAPEVANIKTQVGANGALEVALLNEDSWKDLNLLDVGDFDESVEGFGAGSNFTWGNLVDLGDASFGLNEIVLNPSRLYIEQSGTDDEGEVRYKVNSTILKTPQYGEDGRIKGLDKTSAVALTRGSAGFSEEGHGVRAVGVSANMSPLQLAINTAKSAIETRIGAARTAASNALNASGNDLAGIVIKYAISGQTSGYPISDIEAVRALAVGLQSSLDEIDAALRAAFTGYLATAGCTTFYVLSDGSATASSEQDAYADALALVESEETSLSQLLTWYPGIAAIIPDMATYISKLAADKTKVENAVSACDAKIEAGQPVSWNEIDAIITPLVETNKMTVGGKSIPDLKTEIMGEGGQFNFGAALALLEGGRITITVPSGSGLISDISDFADNYKAKVTVENFSYGGIGPMDVDATMQTATDENPVYLRAAGNGLKGAPVREAEGSSVITDFYGYVLDLAFRTNAEESNLLLQVAPENRIYEGSTENANLQGSGSFMSYETQADLSATKMVNLMQGIRVVFMDDEQNILALAALDCTLGKDVYEILSDDEKRETGMYAYLKGSNRGYQRSDLIDNDTYSILPDTSHVEFDTETGEIKAWLGLREFYMTESTAHEDAEEGQVFYTGGTTVAGQRVDQVITAMPQDTPVRISVLVYLDGSYVDNSKVAANATQSMTGTLNLQFASDAELIPAEITKLLAGDGENTEEPTEPEGGDTQDGEPQSGEPQSGEPQGGEPQGSEPQGSEPQGSEP